MSALWIWVGEINVRAVRKEVFEKVGSREMEWFDLGMGLGDGGKEIREDKEEGVGAAGLMSKFTRFGQLCFSSLLVRLWN
jgi:ATP-binding cassette subfamily B (MDR/TAP) protein 1